MLEMCLAKYVNKNTADYFIHKDLGRFLRGELDFYIKNEVMNLDDVQNAERFADIEKNLRMIQCLRAITLDLITFLAQLEDFQKKLWLKKKFVVAAHYCVTLDRIIKDAPDLLAIIAANEKQWAQWEALGMLEKEIPPSPPLTKGGDNLNLTLPLSPPLQKGDSGGFASRGTVDYLREHPFLMADTALYDGSFKEKLLAAIDNLDESVDGLLIHGDNFQALNLLQERYREQVKCVYIDPPYNTGADGFSYKDSYQHSSWLTMMSDKAKKASTLVTDNSPYFISIDENEVDHLNVLGRQIFGAIPIGTFVWKGRAGQAGTIKTLSKQHEYIACFSSSPELTELKQKVSVKEGGRFEDEKGGYNREQLRQWGQADRREDRPQMFFGIPNPLNDQIEILPTKSDGSDGRWRVGMETAFNLLESGDLDFADDNGHWQVYRKIRDGKVTNVPFGTILPEETATTAEGTKNIQALFGFRAFDYPKPPELIKHLVNLSNSKNGQILDYFAGSGTTGHAIISLNRQDKGHRKYILVEQGEYFDTVLKPRIQKVVYSADWKDGKATAPQTGISHVFKVLKIESYEDTLNNLELRRTDSQQSLLDGLSAGAQEDYLLRYLLDIESRGSLLSVDSFRKPFDCKLKVAVDSAGAFEERSIDLVETFNYLIGLRVKSIDSLRERGIVMVQGTLPTGEKTLVLWRDCEQVDYDALNRFCDRHAINPKDSEFEVVYINGDHNIPAVLTTTEDEGGITRTLKLRQIEPEFLSRMFDGE